VDIRYGEPPDRSALQHGCVAGRRSAGTNSKEETMKKSAVIGTALLGLVTVGTRCWVSWSVPVCIYYGGNAAYIRMAAA
jgi:hypothetical protein